VASRQLKGRPNSKGHLPIRHRIREKLAIRAVLVRPGGHVGSFESFERLVGGRAANEVKLFLGSDCSKLKVVVTRGRLGLGARTGILLGHLNSRLGCEQVKQLNASGEPWGSGRRGGDGRDGRVVEA
jgi:hypothetical protein